MSPRFWPTTYKDVPVNTFSRILIAGPNLRNDSPYIPNQPLSYMSTVSLRYLEDRLSREAPALCWTCEPVSTAQTVAGTSLPEEIQVRASKEGVPVKGSPFYLSGECLLRWGLDASANLICNELSPLHAARRRAGMDWDRLAEI